MKCDTLEEIAKKLDKFHSYESEIDVVKMQYNQEQMWHTMDEAKELGEKIAGEAEKPVSSAEPLFPRTTSQSHACMTLTTAARVNTPPWGTSNLMPRCLRRGN